MFERERKLYKKTHQLAYMVLADRKTNRAIKELINICHTKDWLDIEKDQTSNQIWYISEHLLNEKFISRISRDM